MRNVANDPFASAAFFNFIIWTTLETLLGIHVSNRQVESCSGFVNGYFGVVEVQGRGSLHVHFLIWLKNAPNANEMVELLSEPEFHERIGTYVKYNIWTHLDGFDEHYIENTEHERHLHQENRQKT